ncbi:MAG TPA: ferrous iron transport protein A [Pyrinomonadaceae bacterium]|jgi:ferrous iron transport protein A
MKVWRAESAARAGGRGRAQASPLETTKATTANETTKASPSLDAAKTGTPLDTLPFGVTARVVSLNGERAIVRRLMEMGVVPGAPVRVVKAAPLGDPLEVRVRGYHLALRRAEARTIQVVTENS